MYLVANANVLVDRVFRPVTIRHFQHLLLYVDESSLLNSVSHLVVDRYWIARFLSSRVDEFVTFEYWSICGRATIVAPYTRILLKLFEPSSGLKIVVSALVELVPLIE